MGRFVKFNHYITPHVQISVGDEVMIKDVDTHKFEWGPYKVLKILRLDRDNFPHRYFVEVAGQPWHREGEGQIWDVGEVKVVSEAAPRIISWSEEKLLGDVKTRGRIEWRNLE